MAYITHAELADNPGARELAEVASDEHGALVDAALLDALLRGQDVRAWSPDDVAAGQRALARIDDAVMDADAVIDGYLAKRGYALPLVAPVHRLVAAWSRAIARHGLHKNRLAGEGKDPITRAYKDALSLLQKTADGHFSIGANDAVAINKLDARFASAAPTFGRDQLKAFR